MTDTTASLASAPLDPAPAEPAPGLICAFLFRPGSPAEELPTDQPLPERPEGWLWLHFNLADARAGQFLRSASLLPAPALEALISPGDHQQVNIREGCLYGILADLVCGLDGVTEDLGLLHFALTEAVLVTCRRRALSGVEATRKALRRGLEIPTPAALLECWNTRPTPSTNSSTNIPTRSIASRKEFSPTISTKDNRSSAACAGTAFGSIGRSQFFAP